MRNARSRYFRVPPLRALQLCGPTPHPARGDPARGRIDQLLRKHAPDGSGLTSDQLRILRAIRVLEWSRTAVAQQALKELADRPFEAGLNEDVKNALARLIKQSK